MKFLDQVSRFVAEETRGEPASRGDDMVVARQRKGNTVETLYDRLHIQKRSFDEELAAMIENPPLGSVVMDITPSMATDMLKRNDRNRPLSKHQVAVYAHQMRRGEWRYTRVPVIFSEEGRLIDGQHRLAACGESETAIKVDVVFGAPDDSFAFIDIGRKRTAGDIFTINGVKNAAAMAAATPWVVGYDRGGFTKPGGEAHQRLTGAELYKKYLAHTGLQDGMWVYSRFARNQLASPSLMLALWYICSRKSARDAEAFFDILTEGVGAKRDDPPLALRNRLIKNATTAEKLPHRTIAGLTISAWNLYRAGRSGRALRYDPERAFPRAH